MFVWFGLLGFAFGDAKEDFFESEGVFSEFGKFGAVADECFGNAAGVGGVGGHGDSDLTVEFFGVEDLGMAVEDGEGGGGVGGDLCPEDGFGFHLVGGAGDGAAVDEFAFFDDGDAVAEVLEFAEDVGGDEDGFAHALEFLEDGHHFDAGSGVEAAGGFVEEEELGVVDEDAGESESLLHAAAEGADEGALFVRQSDEFEHVFDGVFALFGGDFVAGAEEVEVFGDFHVFVNAKEVGHVADEVTDGVGVASDVVAEDFGAAFTGGEEGGKDAERGGFAGAVGSDEAEEVASVDLQVERGERRHSSVSAG